VTRLLRAKALGVEVEYLGSMRAAVLGLVAGLLLVLPGVASADDARFHPCVSGSVIDCGRVVVPVDPSGAVKGAMSLHVERYKSHGPNTGTVIALAGGPGQAATPLLPDFAITLDPVLRGRQLVVFDQRGTGFSDQLLCDNLGRHDLPDLGVGGCASSLGALRPFYSTSASVSDMEALRRALGTDKIDLYGVSYGTKVALDYAIRYPEHVQRLLLDSVVMPGALDPYEMSSFAAMSRLVSQICANKQCAGITDNPEADLTQLIQRLITSQPTGMVVNGKGRRRKVGLRRSGILNVLFAGDFDPTLRADFPAAVRAALDGDDAPLLRLIASTTGTESFDPSSGDSEALFAATSCEDSALPWTQSTPVADRIKGGRASFNQIAPSAYAPFDADTVFRFSLTAFCPWWPDASSTPPVETASLPAVPTLILSGDDDLRTPQEDAVKLGSQLAKATVVKVPNVGHSVLGSDLSNCSIRALQHFYRGEPIPPCRNQDPLFSPSPIPPTSISKVKPLRGEPRRVGQTLTSVRFTLSDLFERTLDSLLNSPDGVTIAPVGGLRAGYFTSGRKGLDLHGYSWVPGVMLTGRVPLEGAMQLKVGGPAAARGTLTVTLRGRVTGKLGHTRIHTNLLSGSFARARAVAAGLRPLASLARSPRIDHLDPLENGRMVAR
jgi:pimeloyl-ACP methyl ester carboxylesterase